MVLPTVLFTLTTLTSQLNNYTMENDDNSTAKSTTPLFCRTERGISLPFHIYRVDTCARCYNYLPQWAFVNMTSKYRYNRYMGTLIDPSTNISYFVDPENKSHPIFETFATKAFASKWTSCCKAALKCCEEMSRSPQIAHDVQNCPRTWDGWQCWPDTPAGQRARRPCEEHVYIFSEPPPCPRYAVKKCMPNATWYIHEEYKSEWTNYNGCGRVKAIRRLQYFHIATYAISVLFLVPAILTFLTYKQLQVHRITMHKNLFASLLLNGIFVILFKSIVMLDELDNFDNETTVLDQNALGCKFLFILTKYFRMTNYMWMFCEGFYLHRLIAAAFAEQKNLILFYVIGWGFPIIPITIYAALRQIFANKKCWAMPVDPYEWALYIPNLLSLMLNFAFLCHIIQVLVTKLQAVNANEPDRYRKAVKATLVLVPLFGLHFFLIIYRPQSGGCDVIEAYTFFTYALDGLQGFIITLIFCYFNGEVMHLLKRSYERYKLRNATPGKSCRMGIYRLSLSTQMSSIFEGHTSTNRRTSRQIGIQDTAIHRECFTDKKICRNGEYY